ncbi:MAG: shikimate dehydrogenase [Nesterenkonia sp.]|nr:shikimate dehydrogenase [Nesterenkonia sp.]
MTPPLMRAAVLGSPIGHSRSPELHGAAYAGLGLEVDYRRIRADVGDLDRVLDSLSATGDRWLGLSVTMPLKVELARRTGTASDRVGRLGALNTVVFDAGGRPDPSTAYGENTDVDGIVGALGEVTPRRPRSMAVLGAGATTAAALEAARDLGCADAAVYARSPARAEELGGPAERLGLSLRIRELSTFADDLLAGPPDLVVSALPAGAADGTAASVADRIPAPGPAHAPMPPLLDVAYDPWPSALARVWAVRAGSSVSGLHMLLHQAVEQVRLFTAGTDRPFDSLAAEEQDRTAAQMRTAVGLPAV